MKKLIFSTVAVIYVFLGGLLCNARSPLDPTVEFYFINRIIDQDLYVRFYPIGAVFNGISNSSIPTEYSLLSYVVDPTNPNSGFSRKRGGDKIFAVVGVPKSLRESISQSVVNANANFWVTNNLSQPMNHITTARIKLEQQC